MSRQSIVVEVDTEGVVKIEAVGFKGSACTRATEALEKALGTVSKRNTKPEYYAKEQTHAQAKT